MAKDQSISMPGTFGGLMRYNEEYKSMFMFKPLNVVVVIILFAIAAIALNILTR